MMIPLLIGRDTLLYHINSSKFYPHATSAAEPRSKRDTNISHDRLRQG